ncbi:MULTISPECIES: glycosyltransferase [unclassified Mesotoga]|uniref:glycosyltransferase n=1 Tax=unclassified Mesotoga TaxID=1184398 RepID=UPI000DA6AD04|nr:MULTISPECIES: glycosyltransferase [unclassified Mesotoga]PZC52369.1 hypothetical protein LH53_05150 [Mesotoga sp. TolDC]
MKVLVIGYGHTKNDKRVARTVDVFRQCGLVHYQYWEDSGTKNEEELTNVKNYPLNRNSMKGLGRYGKRFSFDKEILRLVRQKDYDLAYFHFSPALMPVRIFSEAKKRGKIIIYDLHEIMPEQRLPEKASIFRPIMWGILRKQFSLCDGVVFASEDASNYMLRKTGQSVKRFILPNYAYESANGIFQDNRQNEIVVVGGTQRDISISRELVVRLKSKFRIVSIGMKWKMADENIPFLKYEKMMERISRARFTLIAFNSRSDLNYKNDIYSLPHKFYDSLAAGTPVLVAERFVSMRRIVERTGTGLVLNLIEQPNENFAKICYSIDAYDEYLHNLEKYHNDFVWDNSKRESFRDFVEEVCEDNYPS